LSAGDRRWLNLRMYGGEKACDRRPKNDNVNDNNINNIIQKLE